MNPTKVISMAVRLLLMGQAMVAFQAIAQTSIVRDGSLGTGPGGAIAFSGTGTTALISNAGGTRFPETFNKVAIPETYGRRVGSNVFHSFSTFNVAQNDGAVFTMAAPTTNMIARVTGGTASTIGGVLQVDASGTGSATNLFLINPAGLVFTTFAHVDVPGTFHASTANSLNFPDGKFYADTSHTSTFSAADPTAFGFLGTTRQPITYSAFDNMGAVSLVAGDVKIDRGNLASSGSVRIAAVGADTVDVPVTGSMPVMHGDVTIAGSVRAFATTPGMELVVSAGNLAIIGGALESSASGILVNASNDITFNGCSRSPCNVGAFSGIHSTTVGSYNSGSVTVNAAGTINLLHGGEILAETVGAGNAGNVKVSAANIVADGSLYDLTGIYSQSNGLGFISANVGRPGSIDVTVTGDIALRNAAAISNTTRSIGSAGNITVTANNIVMDGLNNQFLRDYGGITSNARGVAGAKANSGNVTVRVADTLSVLAGSRISTTTYSDGSAGNVSVNAANIVVDGVDRTKRSPQLNDRGDGSFASSIQAAAKVGSSGQTGNVSVQASKQITLSNGGQISMQNDATVASPASLAATTMTVTAPTITLIDSQITAASTGNVAASNIKVNFTDLLYLDPSAITTTSNLGNGGSITIAGAGTIRLDSSQISTSVLGLTGNGGDIFISAGVLFMNTGFIQANTAAANASGGVVNINVQAIISSGNSLFVGGQSNYTFQPGVFGFNVIQAAAPTGVAGAVQVSSPTPDISGTLVSLSTKEIDAGGLGRSPCQIGSGNSLAVAGRGGFPPASTGLLGPADVKPGGSTSGALPNVGAVSVNKSGTVSQCGA